MEDLLKDIVRIGTVTAVSGTKARVKFRETGITSGWLFVLQHVGAAVSIPEAEEHTHAGARLTTWTPNVNDTVLCVYLPVFGGDGFILGGVS